MSVKGGEQVGEGNGEVPLGLADEGRRHPVLDGARAVEAEDADLRRDDRQVVDLEHAGEVGDRGRAKACQRLFQRLVAPVEAAVAPRDYEPAADHPGGTRSPDVDRLVLGAGARIKGFALLEEYLSWPRTSTTSAVMNDDLISFRTWETPITDA